MSLKNMAYHVTCGCGAGCVTQAFSASNGANSAVGTVGSFSFTGWNYDVQVQSGFRAIYRLNNVATFKVRPPCCDNYKHGLRLPYPTLLVSKAADSFESLCDCH